MNVNSKLIIQRRQDETSLSRFKMIAPLCDENIDRAKRIQLRREIPSRSVDKIITTLSWRIGLPLKLRDDGLFRPIFVHEMLKGGES